MASKKRIRSFVVLFVIAVGIGAWYFSGNKSGKRYESKGKEFSVPFKKEGTMEFLKTDSSLIRRLDLEIADTEAQRVQGLMYRGTMNDDQAMLFIFKDEEIRTFWMKNTYISLDLLFAAEDGRIVSISRNTMPYSEAPVTSRGKAKYVIEVVAGFCDQYGVEEGDLFAFERQ